MSVKASLTSWLACAGTALTIWGILLKLRVCVASVETFVERDGSVGWSPRTIWIDWGTIPQAVTLLGILLVFSGVSIFAFRVAPTKVLISGLVCSVVAALTLSNSEVLRCAAFGPLLIAILLGGGCFLFGLLRFGLNRPVRPDH